MTESGLLKKQIESKYPNQKKGIFLANDTYANMFLNLIFQKHGTFPSTYEIVGFDNSPIAKTTMDLLVRQMDEQKTRAPSFTIEFCRIASFSGSV